MRTCGLLGQGPRNRHWGCYCKFHDVFRLRATYLGPPCRVRASPVLVACLACVSCRSWMQISALFRWLRAFASIEYTAVIHWAPPFSFFFRMRPNVTELVGWAALCLSATPLASRHLPHPLSPLCRAIPARLVCPSRKHHGGQRAVCARPHGRGSGGPALSRDILGGETQKNQLCRVRVCVRVWPTEAALQQQQHTAAVAAVSQQQ